VKKYGSREEWNADRGRHLASGAFSGKRYGFMLKRAKAFAIPIPQKGKLGLFDVDIGSARTSDERVTSEIFDEEYRTQWINHH